MAKAKSKSIVMVSDGGGGMTPVPDRRFERGEWPIRFDVPKEQADTWFQYFVANCQTRGWNWATVNQMEVKENSGTITINAGAEGQPQMVVVWDRRRDGPIKIRARIEETAQFSLISAEGLFEEVNERCRVGARERFYFRGQLGYDGLPWRGELWLGDALRLGPPVVDHEETLFGPRVIVVDADVDGIDRLDAASTFETLLREVSIFLSVVMRTEIRVPKGGRAWTWTSTPTGQVECDVRNLGYVEMMSSAAMPAKGQAPPIPLVTVQRPDFSLLTFAITPSQTEQRQPADIVDLWRAFRRLPPDKRQQFLEVGNMWQMALSLGHRYQTAKFTWMVAACEALKPRNRQSRDHNIYDVVAGLLGKPTADLLRTEGFRPHDVRSVHIHSGEVRGSEFVPWSMMSSFQDPTFDEACRAIGQITPAAIIEWLRRDGVFAMPPVERRKSWQRRLKEHVFSVLMVVATAALVAGVALGWLLLKLWYGL
jgi:hypothetical protein